MDSTSPSKRKRSGEDNLVDLTSDNENETWSAAMHPSPPKRARGNEQMPSTPTHHRNTIMVPHNARSEAGTTTPGYAPTSTPRTDPNSASSAPPQSVEKQTPLRDMPELADRYIPKASTADGIQYTSPQKFSLKPAYWSAWRPKDYTTLAQHLCMQFDPVSLSQELNKPVEEISHMFFAVVRNPLIDAKVACKRGKDGMLEILAHYAEHGTTTRTWSDKLGGKKIKGELSCVYKGIVEIIREDGIKGGLALADLSEDDMKYLKKTLREEDAQSLFEKPA